jgi:predicted ATPase
MSEQVVESQRSLGARGEYTVHYLSRFGDEHVANHAVIDESAASSRLLDQTQAWLDRICSGVQLEVSPQSSMDIVGLSYSFATSQGPSNSFRPTNTGFGLSYTLPVIVAALAAPPDSCILIENPEAHLHPRGQTAVGRLLARASAGDVQVFLETHSDHVLNGIRLEVKGRRLRSDAVALNYTHKIHGSVECAIDAITLDDEARLSKWPVGFFDEYERVMSDLL